ncbi:MAG: two-component sensor histidine kinase [Pedobacter sp.]|nr:MAG: two-component sensor histidine kinase [Pedobacter sp.]
MGETEYLLIIILFNVFLLAFIVATIAFVIQYKNKRNENLAVLEQQKTLHQKELLTTEIEIKSQTMQHIGREIHDNVGQKLTLASLYTQQLAYENKAPEINEKIENIGEIINQSLAELRFLSKSLTDNAIERGSIGDLLKREVARLEALKKYDIQLDITSESLNLPYETKNVLLRVTQEFLQNTMKYANCKVIRISMLKQGSELKMLLSDDGIGFEFDDSKVKGIGLINMKKRIELIGGRYELKSTRNEGTTLTIEISV